MKILFIGGTKFVGRNIVEMAMNDGHEIYILQRGMTNSDLFLTAKKFIGDRKNISQLIPENEFFDLVIDSCGYHPDIVKISVEYLKNKTHKYIFVSTCSVYEDFSIAGLNESSRVQKSSEHIPVDAKFTNETYGLLKARCETVVLSTFDEEKCLIIRPCIIVGKYDETKRFNLLLEKIKNGETLKVPNDKEVNIQFIDVRALADFVMNANNRFGIYNLVGPEKAITLLEFILLAKSILNPNLQLEHIDPNECDLPMYVANKSFAGFFRFNGEKAYVAGLKKIDVEDTVKYIKNYL